MTLGQRVFVVCDRCHMEQGSLERTSSAARREARRQGWTRRKDAEDRLVDIGPVCLANERRREAIREEERQIVAQVLEVDR